MKNQLLNSSEEHHFQQEQADTLAEIGLKLRQTREAQSMSLEKLAVTTMIRSHILEAIEEGNLDQLPEAIYTQRLIERYANALNLDGKKLANLFPTQSRGEPLNREKVYFPVRKLKAHHLYLVYIFLVIVSIHILSKAALISDSADKQLSNSQAIATSGESGKERGANSADGNLEKSGQSSPSKSVETTYQSQNQNQPVTVSVIVEEDSWVKVEIDGKIEFEGLLERGTQKTWQAQEKLVFLAGNAGGVLVAFNNGQAKQLGEPGAVEQLVWNADNPGYQAKEEVKN
jgi:cytoskeletal protein RodZ